MSLPESLQLRVRLYEEANGLPPLCVMDFVDELFDDAEYLAALIQHRRDA